MNNIIIVLAAFVIAPISLIASLARPTGGRADTLRFIAASLLLAPCVLGVLKLWISPMSSPSLQHAIGGMVEQVPYLSMLLFLGVPGLLHKQNRSRGFFYCTAIFGAALTWLVTAGSVAKGEAPATFLQFFLAYGAVVGFTGWWASAQQSLRVLELQRQH